MFPILKIHKAVAVSILIWGVAGVTTKVRAEAESDLVVGYGAAEAARFGSEAALQAATYAQIATANNVAANSGSPHRQRVAGFIKSAIDCDYLTSTGGMVGWLANYDSHVTDVLAYADSLGADLVTYIFKNGDSVAGVAQQPGRTSAYNDQMYWTYFAHESGGHNFGGNHGDAVINPTTVMGNNYCGGGAQGFYTNPNIWYNGVHLLGTGNCTGGTIYGGDTAYLISTTAQAKADSYERRVWGSVRNPITYRWQFNKPAASAPAGTVIPDEVASSPATVRGQGATFTGTALRLPGGTTGNVAANSIAAYLDLPNGMFSAMANFTIEVWAAPRAAGNWMRVIDIGRTTEPGDGSGAAGEYTGTAGGAAPGVTSAYDDLMLSAAIGTNLNSQRFEAKLAGAGTVTGDSTLTTTAGDLHHYGITFADTATGGRIKWFRDGALVKSLDVPFHSASLHDVNNWLGRSMYSADSMANIDYYDVRIQSIALADGEVAANYRIGPNDKMVTQKANDFWGNSGWISGSWEFGQTTPDASHDYEVGTMRALTPWTTTNSTFPGRSLTVTGGNLYLAGKNAKTATINDLRLNGGTVISLGDNGSTQTLAGNITVPGGTNSQIRGTSGPMIISANITGGVGGGGLTYTENAVTLTAANTGYLGATIIGDGRFSTLKITSETNLGGNPSFYGGGWLQLNRGILDTSVTMTIDDANRGVLIGPSGGFLRPAAGTTLTIATPVNSPAAGNTLQTAPMDSNPISGILFKDGPGTLLLTNPNNSHNAEMQILQGELRLSGNGRFNNGDHWMPFTINGTFNDSSALDQTVRGSISGNGAIVKNNTSTLNVNGGNTFTGSVTINGGTLYANPGNAANKRAFGFVSGITVNSGATLRAGSNGLFGWDGTQERPITVNAGGTLTANGGLASDVGVGTVTLNGGTLATIATGATDWGSWRFDNATDKLSVTADSTVSATNVKFGDAGAAIEVAAAKTLNFTGTITNATGGGISYLKKTGGGTLILVGTNTHTGATAVNSGTLNLTGSLGNTAVTVAPDATLGGNGNIGGGVAINAGGHHALAVAATPGAQLTRTIGGALDLTAVGDILDLTAATAPAAGSYTLVTATGGITGTFSDTVVNLAGIPDGSVAVVANSLVLTVGPASSYAAWTAAQGLTESNNGPDQDPDSDGIANVLEFVLGGNPLVSDIDKLPSLTADDNNFIFTFNRSDESEAEVSLFFQYGSDLASWTDEAIGATSAGHVAVTENATSPDTVVVTIARSLAGGGKLVGRLKAAK